MNRFRNGGSTGLLMDPAPRDMTPVRAESLRAEETIGNEATVDGAAIEGEVAEDATEGVASVTESQAAQYPVLYLSPQRIAPNPQQPRTRFPKPEMKSLTQSVREHGVLQPVTVCTLPTTNGVTEENGDGRKCGESAPEEETVTYQLIAGERRWRAAMAAGLPLIPAIVRDDLSPTTTAEIALVENLQRSDLDPIEEARGYLRLMRDFSLSEARLAQRVGRSRQCIRQSLKLLRLPPVVQQLIARGQLTPSHGQVLRRFAPFPALCVAIARCCVEEEVSAKDLAQEVPNDGDLVDEGLLVYLAAYNTRFDFRRICPTCPHKAFYQDAHGRMYCCKPEAWQQKQETAVQEEVRQREDEAARIMVQAREAGHCAVEVERLAPGSYRDLSSSFNSPPQGCTPSCSCRSTAVLRGREVPICLNPARLAQLGTEHTKREKEARIRSVSALSEAARSVVIEEWRTGRWNKGAPLLAQPLLRAQRSLVEEAARRLNFAFPLSRFFDRKAGEGGKWQVLGELDADQVLALTALVTVMKEAREAVEWSGHELFATRALLGRLGEAQTALPAENTEEEEQTAEMEPSWEPEEEDVEFQNLQRNLSSLSNAQPKAESPIEDDFEENYRREEEIEPDEEDFELTTENEPDNWLGQ